MSSNHITEKLVVQPYFDIEILMQNSQETRIDGPLMDRLLERWEEWMKALNVIQIKAGEQGYLVVWLDESVEEMVDDIWEETPSEAFLYNALAQTMCMSALHELLPEIEEAGCAPAPKPTPEFLEALEAEGVPYLEDGPALARRYAVATFYPFRGACEICSMRNQCPKLLGTGGDNESVVFPGYERGK